MVACAVAGTWWAASTVLNPAETADDVPAMVPTYTVVQGEVGVTASQEGEIAYPAGPPGLAGVAGTLTSLDVDPAVPVDAGDVAFTVDLRPVVVAEGEVPAFRELSRGASGPDVAQLRALLGMAEGSSFDAATEAAVRTWQKELGIAGDGVVRLGDVLFLPSLPTGAYPHPDMVVGAPISLGQQVIVTAGDVPDVVVIADSSGTLQQGMVARFAVGSDVMEGVLGPAFDRSDGLRAYAVVDEAGNPVCGSGCARIASLTAPSRLSVEVDLVPAQSGLVVPDSALVTQPDGSLAVRDTAGAVIPVEIVVQGQGMSVVEGVDEGTVIELFGSDLP